MKHSWTILLAVFTLGACGGGGSSVGVTAAPTQINAADYKLPSALPSVPDQAGKN